MIGQFLSGDGGQFVVFLLVMAALWLWTFWDCVRNPRRPPPLHWYHFAASPAEDQWDLQALNRDYVVPSGERKAGPQPGTCPR